MKTIDSMWFNSRQGHFGFVLAEDETTGKRTIFAGVIPGLDQQSDEKEVISCGNRVNIPMLEELLSKCKQSEVKNTNHSRRKNKNEK